MFACQFHTCAVSDYTLSFTRSELDYACDGKAHVSSLPLPGVRTPERILLAWLRAPPPPKESACVDTPRLKVVVRVEHGVLTGDNVFVCSAADLRFPLDGAVELHFSPTPEPRLPSPAPTPAVPTLDSTDDPVTRWDSYEHLGGGSDGEDDDAPSGECFLHPPRPRHGEMCNVRCLTSSCARLGKHLFRKGKLIHCQAH